MTNALIVYTSRTDKTEQIGTLVAEGLRMSGVEVIVKKAGDIKNGSDLEGFGALVWARPRTIVR